MIFSYIVISDNEFFNECCRYERISWLPVIITFIIVSAVGGKHLSNPPSAAPATVSAILSFASTLAGFSITFSPISCDFSSYYRPNVSRCERLEKLFKFNLKDSLLAGSSSYLSMQEFYYPSCVSAFSLFFLTSKFSTFQVSLQCLGAAVAVVVSSVPVWEQGYAGGNVGGLFEAILRPLGNFGKFLTVLLSLSVAGNNVAILYSASLNLQMFMPILVKVPRYIFSIVATAL